MLSTNLIFIFTERKEDRKDSGLGGELSASYLGIKAALNAKRGEISSSVSKRAVELPINPQSLAKFLGSTENLWIIEDFHKINEEEKEQITQIMKVFMDFSVHFPKLKIIVVGAVNSARDIIQYNQEMRNRISEIEVSLMNYEELFNILLTGQKLLNIKIQETL
jgi:hypothetical protein